jgi:predicted MFS family arabinose efflux permease
MNPLLKPLWTRDFILAFVANFFMAFSFYLLMPTLPVHLIQTMRATPAMAGVVMAVYVVAGLCIRPFSGFLIDYFPRKKFYVAVFALFTLCGVLYFGAVAVWIFIAVRLLHGLVWGLIIPAGNTIAIDIVPAERRGEGIGYYGMSMNIAMALGPLLGIVLQDHLDFRWVVGGAAGTSLLGLLVSLWIRVPFHAPHAHAVLSLDRFILRKGIPGAVAMLFLTVSYGLLLAYASLYGKMYNIAGTGFFFVLISVGFILSRMLCSSLLDKGWTVRLALLGATVAAVALVALGLFPVAAVYFVVALLLGFAYGVGFPALQNWIIQRAEHHQRGTANSTFFTAFDLGVGAGMLFGGQMAQVSSLSNAWLASAGCAVVSILVLRRLTEK